MASIGSSLYQEIHHIIASHLAELGHYVPVPENADSAVPEEILACVELLSEMTQHSPRSVSYEIYREACHCFATFHAFLQTMNQKIDAEFQVTNIGQVYLKAKNWQRLAEQNFKVTLDEAWDILAPAIPDHLEDLGDGQFEARWWKPVPVMDIEIIKYTEGVEIQGKPFEPKSLPGGLGLRFTLTPEARAS